MRNHAFHNRGPHYTPQLSPQPYLCHHSFDFPLRLVEAVVERNRVEAIAKVRQVRQELHSARGSSLSRKRRHEQECDSHRGHETECDSNNQNVSQLLSMPCSYFVPNDTPRRLLQNAILMTTSKIFSYKFCCEENKKPEHSPASPHHSRAKQHPPPVNLYSVGRTKKTPWFCVPGIV